MAIIKIDLCSNYSIIYDGLLELRFDYILDDDEKSIVVGINKDGEIKKCSSLISTVDNFNYYLQMADVIKDINKIQGEEGKYLFNKINHIVSICERKNDEVYKKYDKRITTYLDDDIDRMRKKYRRLRRADKKEALEKEINIKENELRQIRKYNKEILNKIEEINNDNRIASFKQAKLILNDVFEKLY